MVRDLERKDEAQRAAWEGEKILGDCSYPHSRFSQCYPIFHFLSPLHLTKALARPAWSPQGLVLMSLVRNLLARILGLESKREAMAETLGH